MPGGAQRRWIGLAGKPAAFRTAGGKAAKRVGSFRSNKRPFGVSSVAATHKREVPSPQQLSYTGST